MTISGDFLTDKAIKNMIGAGIDGEDARLEVSIFSEAARDTEEFDLFVERRIKGEPMAYIVGYRDFYRDRFDVIPGVLIPRSDTEILVECALRFSGALDLPMGDVINIPESSNDMSNVRFADLCTGTGCVGISVYNELRRQGKNAKGILTDISSEALSCAGGNVKRIAADPSDIEVIKDDVLHDDECGEMLIPDSFDIIMSNPPYINESDMKVLDDIVKDHEPHLALAGGEDGLMFYQPIASKAKRLLRTGGALMVEHGYDQGEAIRDIFRQNGFNNVTTLRDYGFVDRVTFGVK